MKTELKLTLNNLKSNIKRTLFTIISIMLCSILIFTTTILVSSIKNGIIEISEKEKNDYHVILKDLSNKDFEKIKNKEYIEKIYIQKINDTELTEVDGRRLVFKVAAYDEAGLIGEGTHERFIVQNEKFQTKANNKLAK